METNINFDAMRIRIEFLYRLTCMLFATPLANQQSEGRLSARSIDELASAVATQGCHLIFKHRRDDGFTFGPSEIHSKAICQLIVSAFNDISLKIHEECEGLPITLTLGKTELCIIDGIDELMEQIKSLLTETEVSNG
jgi:ADP-dependent phosphofructokinase/glucokinase